MLSVCLHHMCCECQMCSKGENVPCVCQRQTNAASTSNKLGLVGWYSLLRGFSQLSQTQYGVYHCCARVNIALKQSLAKSELNQNALSHFCLSCLTLARNTSIALFASITRMTSRHASVHLYIDFTWESLTPFLLGVNAA